MEAADYEEDVVSILRGREGWDVPSSIVEFKELLNEGGLVEEEFEHKWVVWKEPESYEQQPLDGKIKNLLRAMASTQNFGLDCHCLVQFWGVLKVEGSHHYLSTSNYPFFVNDSVGKEVGRYRKLCVDRILTVDVDAAQGEQLGGSVERAYRNKLPESTPDLRLYSANEFPLRDEAVRSGFTDYMALPIFDLDTQECYGVLEFLSRSPAYYKLLFDPLLLYAHLQAAGLRSSCYSEIHIDNTYTVDTYQRLHGINEILELAIRAVPSLSLAQVWISCKQCLTMSWPNLMSCMEMTSFIPACHDYGISCYREACEFHNQQLYRTCFLRNISDLTISEYPLAHYAKKARLSHCFSVSLQSITDSSDPFVVIQFFLRLKNRGDACNDSSLHLLLRILDLKLHTFKIEQLPEELLVQSSQSNAIESEYFDLLHVMDSYEENISESSFITTFEASCWQRPSEDSGWVFHSTIGEDLTENDKESNIERFMKIIADEFGGEYWIMQFWAPAMVENRYCLQTLHQPYAVGCLQKGLSSFRKECIQRRYFVDDEANEDELGPPGRVFINGRPEATSSLFLYSTKEFSMRDYAVHCHLQNYCALPIYDEQEQKCVGVLEFLGIGAVGGRESRVLEFMGIHDDDDDDDEEEEEEEDVHDHDALKLQRALKEAHLNFSPIHLRPRFRADVIPANIKEALNEVKSAFEVIKNLPQLYLAKAWISYEESASNARCCVELALTTECKWKYMYPNLFHWLDYIQPKKGMLGMVLGSVNKTSLCRNMSEFSIADQPLALVEREKRLDVCFSVCLQSSHTRGLLYVLEFFLIPGQSYLQSFFQFLLPILKQQLPSFKYSFGKQIGEDLVVEVIEFTEANNPAFSELGQLDVFPIKFKRVLYGQVEHQQAEDESEQYCVSDAMQTEQGNAAASDFNKTSRGKRKTSLPLSYEDVQPHFGKKINDVAKELGVPKSAIKLAYGEFGKKRWPGNKWQQNMHPLCRSLPQRFTSLHQNVTRKNTESTQQNVTDQEAEKVMVRVKYDEDTVKFELCVSLGVNKLFEEVARRLNLEIGSFKLKYVDEDNEEILIACDDDLQLCAKSQTASGKTCIQLFVPKTTPEELLASSRQSIAIESEPIDMLYMMDSYEENLSEPDFIKNLETSCCQRPSEDSNGGWIFHTPVKENIIENGSKSDLLVVPSMTQEN